MCDDRGLQVVVSNGWLRIKESLRLLVSNQALSGSRGNYLAGSAFRDVEKNRCVVSVLDCSLDERRKLSSLRQILQGQESAERRADLILIDTRLLTIQDIINTLFFLQSKCLVLAGERPTLSRRDFAAIVRASASCPDFHRLELHGCIPHKYQNDDLSMYKFPKMNCFSSLETLAITGNDSPRIGYVLNNEDLFALATPSLTSLDISFISSKSVDIHGFNEFLAASPSLLALIARRTHYIAWDLLQLPQKTKLRLLDISGSSVSKDSAYPSIHGPSFLSSLTRVDTIIDFHASYFPISTFFSDDTEYHVMSMGASSIRSLCLANNNTDSLAQAFFYYADSSTFLSDRLSRLDLSFCCDYKPYLTTCLIRFAARWSSLTHLALAAVSLLQKGILDDEQLMRLLGALPSDNLRFLDVRGNKFLSPNGVVNAVLASAPRLQVLYADHLGRNLTQVKKSDVANTNIVDLNGHRGPAGIPSGKFQLPACLFDTYGTRSLRFKQGSDYYHCLTCHILGNNAICTNCIRTCHRGHDIRYVGRSPIYCDCPLLCSRQHDAARKE